MRNATLGLAVAGCLAGAATAHAAPPSVAEVMAALNKKVKLHAVAVSPDGTRVAWVEQIATPDGPASDQSTIQVADRSGGRTLKVTAKEGTPHDESEPTFSPDGALSSTLGS